MTSPLPGASILVADDDPGIRKLVSDCLRGRGFAVREAQDGVVACELAEAAPPDLVLLDILLPRRDGYSVLLHFRSLEATRAVPVVLMSGESEEQQAAIARTLGAQAFLAKPFMISQLISAVESALKINSRSTGSP
jgi:CheY-like chemotaxis protein